jgi:hypothetical protein
MTNWLLYALRLLSPSVFFLAILVPPSGQAQVGVLDSRIFCVPMEVHEGAPVEKPCLNELKKAAKRDGSVLTLKLDDGKTKTIRDSKGCNDPAQEASCISYRLVGYIGDKLFIVAVEPYECGSILLINRRTGKETVLLGWPILSPNKKRLIVTASSVAGECNPAYAVAIFSLANDLPQLEWHSAPPAEIGDYEYDGWDGDNRVLLRTETDGNYRTAHLALTAEGWKLTDQRGN